MKILGLDGVTGIVLTSEEIATVLFLVELHPDIEITKRNNEIFDKNEENICSI